MYLQLCWLTFFKATVYLYGRVGYTKDKRIKNFQFIGSKTKLGNQRFKNVFPSNSTCLSFDCRLSGLQESTKGLEPSQRFPYFLVVALGAKYFNSNGFRRKVWFWICLELLKKLISERAFVYWCFCAPVWIIDFMLKANQCQTAIFLTCIDQSNLSRRFKWYVRRESAH